MRKYSNPLLFSLLLCIVLSSCDLVPGPKIDRDVVISNAGKKVLLEEFTGQQCGYCTNAHAQAKSLLETYGMDLVVITVHAGQQAAPFPALDFTADYRTSAGNQLDSAFGISAQSLPAGMIGRRDWPGSGPRQSLSNWGSLIAQTLAETPLLDIELSSSYDESSREASLEMDFSIFEDLAPQYDYVVQLTQDSIVSKQYDYSHPDGYQDEYVHLHMLRATITDGGPWGESLKEGDLFLGETVSKTASLILEPDMVAKHCHWVVYVLDRSNRNVVQVEQVKVLP